VAEVVFAVLGGADFVPGEVDAAARAGFADCGEEIHDCESILEIFRAGFKCRMEFGEVA